MERLVENAELAAWARETEASIAGSELAQQCRYWATVQVRTYGSDAWNLANMPARARMIAVLIAKNAYLNPANKTSEGLAVFRDGFREADFSISEEWQRELAALAAGQSLALIGTGGSLGILGFGDEEKKYGDFYVRDTSGSDWGIPWYDCEGLPPAERPTDMTSTYFHTITAQVAVAAYTVVDWTGRLLDRATLDDAYAQPFITLQSGLATNPVRAMVQGILINPGWDLTPGLPIWMADNGSLTQTRPDPVTGWVRVLGTAVDEVTAWINPHPATDVGSTTATNSFQWAQSTPEAVWVVVFPPTRFDRPPNVSVYVNGVEVMANVDISGWVTGSITISLTGAAVGVAVLG